MSGRLTTLITQNIVKYIPFEQLNFIFQKCVRLFCTRTSFIPTNIRSKNERRPVNLV